MKNLKLKINLILISSVIITSCGRPEAEAPAVYYKKQEVTAETLEVSIEASGIIEAISSIEIKSKASGEVLFWGQRLVILLKRGQ